ncbi:hypothetical protein [Streptomyces sp. NPDC048332]|uniref:hypothetical protein n=1 Tax=Streptomyces sp. NPDC048332 TaxID=3154619 RepID=UPI00342B0819
MATFGYAGIRVPEGADAPAGPGALAELALDVDPHLVQHVTDAADRDAQYAAAPLHTLVSAEDGSLWIKTSAETNTWATISEPLSAWRPISLKSGFETLGTVGVRRTDGVRVHLKGRLQHTDGTFINDPNCSNVGSVPPDCIPVDLGTWVGGCSLGGDTINAAGRFEVLGSNTSSAYGVAGDILWWYQGPGGTAWVDLAGSYWMD